MSESTETPLIETDEAVFAEGQGIGDVAEPETLEQHVEQVATEAKKSFSLRERLSGFKHRRDKVVLFLDLEVMQQIGQAAAKADALFASAERIGITDERRTELLDQHNVALDEKGRLVESLKDSIAAAHIKTIAGPDSERAVRRARKRISAVREVMLKRASDESLPDEQRADAREWLEDEQTHLAVEIGMQTMVFGLEKVAFSDGEITDLKIEDVRELHDTLPANQWQDLYDRFGALLFDDHVARQAVDEPGFSQGS